ncbi:MAG: Bcr/CflA family drug resistance efflux transporter [Ramlibacter sp.]|nr:Bcr/CflA family drug resistance efflux transporter [Ramlibacter sp.]
MQRSFFGLALVLGLVSAVGPFAIDMYLPALPTIGQALGASPGAVQATLIAFFLALGAGQVVYGPVSDMLGRKAPLYFGLALFGASSIGCALAPDAGTLIVLRFLQGLGACAGMVIPRAVVRDLHTGPDAARLMSMLMLVFSVSPILAPLTGSLLIDSFGWRAVFWAVAVAAVLSAVLLFTSLPETRPPQERVGSSFSGALQAYGMLLRDRHFLGLSLIGGFGVASFFAYLANARWGARFGLGPMVKVAVTAYALVMAVAFALQLAGVDSLAVMLGLLFVGYGALGLVVPATMVLSMEEHGTIAGTASALGGTLHFVAGIAGSALLACALAWGTLRQQG